MQDGTAHTPMKIASVWPMKHLDEFMFKLLIFFVLLLSGLIRDSAGLQAVVHLCSS